MRRNIPAIFAILALLVLILCSACFLQSSPANVQPSPDKTSLQNAGLARISVPEESSYISFDQAHQALLAYMPDPTNESPVIKAVYFIHGTNVDEAGNATGWIFGVRHSGGTGMLAYDRSGWKTIPWNASSLSEPIDVDRIVPPGILFSRNKAVILGNPSPAIPERRDLDFAQGIYRVTINSGSPGRTLSFNATTGELVTSP
jgi:hypothetical protein